MSTPTITGPTTAAGRDYCGCNILDHGGTRPHNDTCACILAIETEAAARHLWDKMRYVVIRDYLVSPDFERRLAKALVDSDLAHRFMDYAMGAHPATMSRETPAEIANGWAPFIATALREQEGT